VSKILILSNGHGEDLSGSLLASKLADLGEIVDALPLVGHGKSYKKKGIPIVGKTKEFSTGGLGYNSLRGKLNDLVNGQIIYIIKKLVLTLFIKKDYDYLLVVGDVVPLFFAWISRKKYFVYLVAYSSHYEGKLNLPWPCKYILSSSKNQKIYARDLLTSDDLTLQLGKKVYFLGNPFMDKLLSMKRNSNNLFSIAFLPGSRIPEVFNNLYLMLDLLEEIAKYKFFKKITLNFACINDLEIEKIQRTLNNRNWKFENEDKNSRRLIYKHGFIKVQFLWDSFDEILINSDLIISMSGTAAEQAVGLSKPVIQIEGKGPQFTSSFAEAQRRLLGKSVFCITKFRNKKEQIQKTIDLILKTIYLIRLNDRFLASCQTNAKNRLGEKGAIKKIVNDLLL